MDALILRESHLSCRALVTLARRLSPWLGPGLILHARHPDALDIASASGWGLHLPGHADLAAARHRVTGLLGASCHTQAEVAEAEEAGCDYVLLSPIYRPHSKPTDGREPLGLGGMRKTIAGSTVPVIALGGMTPTRAQRCVSAGAHGVATIGGLFGPDIGPEDCMAAARDLRAALDAG